MAIHYNAKGAVTDSGAATTLNPALPATTAGILIAIVQTTPIQAHSCSTPGWVQVCRQDTASDMTTTIWASNGGAAPTFTWASSGTCRALVTQYTDAGADLTYGTPTGATGNDATAVSVSGITSTANNTLAVVMVAMTGNTSPGIPGGWTRDLFSSGSSTSRRLDCYSKALVTSGTAAGTFTASALGFGSNWTANMFEIKPGTIPIGGRRRQLVNVN